MKKFVVAVLLLLVFAVLAGCSQGTESGANHQDSGSPSSVQEGISDPDNTGNEQSGIENGEADGIMTDSGRYVGQIDNNFIEIKISGVPDQLAAKSFMLAYDYNEEFQKLDLQTGEVIKFRYTLNEHGQPVIFEITRL